MPKINIDEFDININAIADNVVLGPQRHITDKLRYLNNAFITRTHVYGNRSMLEPYSPLGVTNTYRWKPGYKDIILKTIHTRFDQYDKSKSNLTTLLKNRPERMAFDKKRFIKDVLELDGEMKTLRDRGITMNDTIETATNKFDSMFETLRNNVTRAERMIQNFKQYDVDTYIWHGDVGPGIDNDLYKWNNARIVFEIAMLEPSIQVINGRGVRLGVVPICPVYVSVSVPLAGIVDSMFTKSLGSLRYNDVKGKCMTHESQLCWSIRGKWMNKYGDNLDSRSYNRKIYEHPFLSSHVTWSTREPKYFNQFIDKYYADEDNNWIMNQKQGGNEICVGNTGNDIYDAAVNLDPLRIINVLQSWQTYKLGTTGPLNNIDKAILYVSPDYHENFIQDVGLGINQLYSRILQMHGMEEIISRDCISYYEESYDTIVPAMCKWYKYDDIPDAEMLKLHHGWDFTLPNWCPSAKTVEDFVGSATYNLAFNGIDIDEDLPFDERELSEENFAMQDEIICNLQQSILEEVLALKSWLDDNECQSRETDNYKQIINFLERVDGNIQEEIPVQKDEVSVKEETREETTHTLEEIIDSLEEQNRQTRNYQESMEELMIQHAMQGRNR